MFDAFLITEINSNEKQSKILRKSVKNMTPHHVVLWK